MGKFVRNKKPECAPVRTLVQTEHGSALFKGSDGANYAVLDAGLRAPPEIRTTYQSLCGLLKTGAIQLL